MRFALSTNWCNRRLATGEEIAELALSLGFTALELGYHTTPQQTAGFKARLNSIPVGSVHAFCPVPLSAPEGYPELYSIADANADARKIAHLQILRTVMCAADMGASTVVLHAGRVSCAAWFKRNQQKARVKRGAKTLDRFKAGLELLIPTLEAQHVTLALENLPYLEGFPNEEEMARLLKDFAGAPLAAWFDTGHHRVRVCNKWIAESAIPLPCAAYRGMHLNDVVDIHDDHLAPGFGKVDFAALKPLAEHVEHIVFEPAESVSETALRNGLDYIQRLWSTTP